MMWIMTELEQFSALKITWLTELYTHISKFIRNVDELYGYSFVPAKLLLEAWETKMIQ